ncbi:plasmid like TrbL protein, component of conjugation system [Aromatoleum aromaticum EbN1]|uniref:Plasmid like TrbL protein, component of conjugation system n=1 Tax=Aromatoleum aromaticum (strain DSM 19018 / LMG 30748 / EbN1) TaxID=76114 RepID=Q5P933_AROAE|nr:P-type conjugative transfer protein TrbL [Aromatoleum aromaticum]CAI06176.1 plasmid like TrbL protein, component of conjugation system [Aromatoleum aromaticum EbN1]
MIVNGLPVSVMHFRCDCPVLRLMLMMSMLLLSGAASAAIEPSGVLDQVADRFLTESAAWASKITEYATWLFWTLVVISMVWTFGMMALRKADIGEFFAELVKFTIFTGFFWWLLLNGPGFAMSIIDSLRNIGSVAAGISRDLTPSRPIDIAFDILVKAGKSYTVLSPIDNLSIFFTTLAILACMGVVAANVLLALVNAWVLAYAGIFVLGFGGSRWTSDIAINYFRAVTGIALKLMTMTLLIGVAVSVMDGYHADLQEGAPLRELLVIFVVALVLAVLIHSIPNMIAGLIPGGGHAASSGSSFSAGAVGGAALGAGAALASGGAALVAGGAAAAGGAQALMAAVSKASQNVASGTDALAGLFGGIGLDGNSDGAGSFAQAAGLADGGGTGPVGARMGSSGSTGKSEGSGQTRSGSPQGSGGAPQKPPKGAQGDGVVASAAQAGRVAVETGAVLASALAEAAKNAAADRISQTAGGRLGASILASMAEQQSPAFDGNSLTGAGLGGLSADHDDEVASFVNRPRAESAEAEGTIRR